uniref:Metal-independent phosphoserine phosphatase isoform X2 n=1 Tax=Tanacetum cinerariifolium TaxID=118510 RepID=A0A6L2L4X4_TANCI|nr:metal-independent phosphoserine phosphatase isoform X2 [Tanacetum cinerariifolium]
MEGLMRNRYWILRHGKSIPNETGLIVSSMENGKLEKYKLASEGINQAQLAGELFLKELKENDIPLENVRICYSPFSRTTHTAEVVASVLGLSLDGLQCKIFEDLRERYFGHSFELRSHEKYSEIWDLDEKDPFMKPEEDGESVADVVSRLTSALVQIESEFQGCAILIVSHGDPLQILQTILNAVREHVGPDGGDLASRVATIKVPSVLSQHRKHALLTGQLRAVV